MKNNKLISLFASHGDNTSTASTKVGIKKNTLYKKVSGKTDFTASEILRIKNVYGLTAERVNDIFFD